MHIDLSIFSKALELTEAMIPHVSPELKTLLGNESLLLSFFASQENLPTHQVEVEILNGVQMNMKKWAILFGIVGLHRSIEDSFSTAPEDLRIFASNLKANGLVTVANSLGRTDEFIAVTKRMVEIEQILAEEIPKRETKPYLFQKESFHMLTAGICCAFDYDKDSFYGVMSKLRNLANSLHSRNENYTYPIEFQLTAKEAETCAYGLHYVVYEFDSDEVISLETIDAVDRDVINLRSLFREDNNDDDLSGQASKIT